MEGQNPFRFNEKAVATPVATEMKKICLSLAALLAAGGTAFAASVVNRDSEPYTLIVTEGSNQAELSVPAGATLEFCPTGCFVTMPDGDRQVLIGSETIEISGGKGVIK
jgi:hypothetical protein